jgi:hypothetical protein
MELARVSDLSAVNRPYFANYRFYVQRDSCGSNFHGQKRSNDTYESTTDADARLYKKSYGKESKLAYLAHALVENRNGLIAAAMVT